MTKKGSKLEFISWINRDGSGVSQIPPELLDIMQNETFDLIGLSMTHKTFIASNFNLFVVKIKPKVKK